MMFRRAPMSYLAKPDLIKEFFEELGFRLILTSPHVPPVILLHAGAFYMHFTDYEDEAERELILNFVLHLASAPANSRNPVISLFYVTTFSYRLL